MQLEGTVRTLLLADKIIPLTITIWHLSRSTKDNQTDCTSNVFRVNYSTCLAVQEAMLCTQTWNWYKYLHGALPPFCSLWKGGSCSNSLSFPLGQQSHHRGKAENASPSTAVDGLCQESMIPTLLFRNPASHWAKGPALTQPKEISSQIPKPC